MREVAWLIERGSPAEWWMGRQGNCSSWTTFAGGAVRFAREVDARRLITFMDIDNEPCARKGYAKAVEHMWMDNPAPALSDAEAPHRAALPDVADSVSPRIAVDAERGTLRDASLAALEHANSLPTPSPAASVEAEPTMRQDRDPHSVLTFLAEPSDDLVARLRMADHDPGHVTSWRDLACEAADAIERLTRERDQAHDAVRRLTDGQPFEHVVAAHAIANATSELTDRLERMRKALQAADAMRDAAVAVIRQHIIPGGWSDAQAASAIYAIFDGPLQREYDKARAALGGER